MKGLFFRQLKREFIFACRDPRQMIYASLFFMMMLVFFPLTIAPDTKTLRMLAPGLIWIDLLFAFFLSSEQLFQRDYEDGIIEQWLVSGESLLQWINAKVFMHWLLAMFPMLILSPVMGIFLQLSAYEIGLLILSLLCGTPAILYLCAFAAALSTGLKQKGILMALVVFPLTVPVMIFGSSTLSSGMTGMAVDGYLAILLAISVLTMGFLPFAMSAVVRGSLAD